MLRAKADKRISFPSRSQFPEGTPRPKPTIALKKLKQQILKDIAKHGAPTGITFAESRRLTEGNRNPDGSCPPGEKPISNEKCAPVAPTQSKAEKVQVQFTDKTKKSYNWAGTKKQAELWFKEIKAKNAKATPAAGASAAAGKQAEKKSAEVAKKREEAQVYITSTYQPRSKELLVIITDPKDSVNYLGLQRMNKKAKGTLSKALEIWAGDFKQKKPPSVLSLVYNKILEQFGKRFKNYELKGSGLGVLGSPQLEFHFPDAKEAAAATELINKNWKYFYQRASQESFRAVRDIKGKPTAKGGFGSFLQNLTGIGASDKGEGAEFRSPSAYGKIAVEEKKQLEFSDTLAGRRYEKLSEALLDEKFDIKKAMKQWKEADFTAPSSGEYAELEALEGAKGGPSPKQIKKILQDYEKARNKSGTSAGSSGFGLDDYLYMKYGDKIAGRVLGNPATQEVAKKTGLTKRLVSGGANKVKASWKWSKDMVKFAGKQHRAIGTFGKGAKVTRGGQFASRGAQWFTRSGARLGSTAARVGGRAATSAGLSNLTSAAGASAGGIAAAIGVGAALGTGIGWAINKMISGDLEEDRKRRLVKASADPQFAEWELEVLCTGKGKFCTGITGKGAPDGWQVKCAGQRGGYEYETGEGGLGYDPGYADPGLGGFTDARDRIQVADSYDKKDMEDAIMFLSFLFKDDHNNGLVKDHFEEKEKGKSAVGKIELQDGSKLKEWESCWKKNMEPLAERTLSTSTAEVKKAYKLIQHAYGLPLVEVAFEKGEAVPGAAAATADAPAGKEAEKTPEQEKVHKLQTALIKYYGPEFQSEILDEFEKSVYGPKTKAKLSDFRVKFRSQMPRSGEIDDFVEFVDYIIKYEKVYGKDFDPSKGPEDPEAAAAAAAAKGPIPDKFTPEQITKYLVSKNLVASPTDPKIKQIIAKLIGAQNKGESLDFKKIDLVARTMLAETINTDDIYTKRLLELNKKMFKMIN